MVNTSKQGGSLDGQRRQKESIYMKLLAFTQKVEQVMGLPSLHLRHAIQGFGGQGKTRTSTIRRSVSQVGKHGKGRGWPDRVLTEGSWKVTAAQEDVDAVAR
jgi:hypothetical protein